MIVPVKISNDTIGNRTRHLPAWLNQLHHRLPRLIVSGLEILVVDLEYVSC